MSRRTKEMTNPVHSTFMVSLFRSANHVRQSIHRRRSTSMRGHNPGERDEDGDRNLR